MNDRGKVAEAVVDSVWAPGRPVWHLELAQSTQDCMRSWVHAGAPSGAVVLVDRQTAGRGRQGRKWVDPGPGNLFVSLVLRSPGRPKGLPSFSPLVAWTLREALGRPAACGLKWPNDLWWEGRKFGGVLLESLGGEPTQVIVGVGLNLRRPPRGWGELEGQATSLEEQSQEWTPTEVLRRWLPVVEEAWSTFSTDGFAPWRERWNRACVLRGRRIRWVENEREWGGIAQGVDDEGSLQVLLEDGRSKSIHAGEVHLGGGTG